MSFTNRFEEVYSSVEIELASSLPVCNSEQEFLFFYSVFPEGENSIKLGTIHHLFVRNNDTGEISEGDINTYFGAVVCEGSVIHPSVFDEEALMLEEEYYNNYEQFYQTINSTTSGAQLYGIKDNLTRCFNKLYPSPAFKELYRKIGESMFDF